MEPSSLRVLPLNKFKKLCHAQLFEVPWIAHGRYHLQRHAVRALLNPKLSDRLIVSSNGRLAGPSLA